MSTEIIQQTEKTRNQLLQTFGSFDLDQINVVPFEGSWTAGQVADHVLKSASGGLAVINGQVKPTERDATAKVQPLKDLFLNFEIKMISPDFILPSDAPHNQQTLINELDKTFTGISTTMQAKDNTATCLDFDMPEFGELTRMEWVSFVLFHTQRHIHQLTNISGCLSNIEL